MKKRDLTGKAKESVANSVVFDPVVGVDYQKHGRAYLGRRVMILGASHYCEHFCREKGCGPACAHYGKYYLELNGGERLYFGDCCERFTEIVYERYRNRLKVPRRPEKSAMADLRILMLFSGNPPTIMAL